MYRDETSEEEKCQLLKLIHELQELATSDSPTPGNVVCHLLPVPHMKASGYFTLPKLP